MTAYPKARGPRVFPESQFPGLPNIFQTIQEYRERFAHLEEARDKKKNSPSNKHGLGFNPQEFHFHPVISIFGRRGAGKTSALLTLLDKIERQSPQDLVLTPLDPHRFMHDDHILFWFLAALEPLVNQVSNESKQDWFRQPRSGENYLETQTDNTLQSLFHELSNQARWIYQIEGFSAQEARVEKQYRQHYLAKEFNFAANVSKLVEKLTEYHASKVDAPSDYKKPPLLILPIDDADLVPEHLEDILAFIRILSPWVSRLVMIVTADVDLALMSSKGRYIRMMFPDWITNERNSQIFTTEEVNRTTHELASQFLTKFFPHEGRLHVREFDETRRMEFVPVPESNSDQLQTLLEKVGLRQFFALDWAIRQTETDKNKTPIWSKYLAMISTNPRLLEQGYDLLRRTIEENTEGKPLDFDCRQNILEALSRLFILEPYSDVIQRLKDKFNRQAVGNRRVIIPVPEVTVNLEFLPLNIGSQAIKNQPNSLGQDADLRLFGFYDAVLRVYKVSSGNSVLPGRLMTVPNALVYAYLFCQELQREGWAALLGDSLPGVSLTSIGRIRQRFNASGSNTNGSESSLKPLADTALSTEERPHFSTIYPLAVSLKQSGEFYCLPMPAWRFPIQWWVYLRFWDSVCSADLGYTEGKRQVFLVFHLVECAIKITRMDPTADDPAPAGLLDEAANVPSMSTILVRLQIAFKTDIVSGDGIIATWVEQGLYRFLKLTEQKQINPFLQQGLTAAKIRELVLLVTVKELETEKMLQNARLSTIIEELDQNTEERVQESRLFRAFQEKMAFAGASGGSVGLMGDFTLDEDKKDLSGNGLPL